MNKESMDFVIYIIQYCINKRDTSSAERYGVLN